MNTHSRFSSILATVMVMILALPGAAWAGGGRCDNGANGYGHQKKGQCSSHYNHQYQGGYYHRGGRYYFPKDYAYKSCGNNKSHHHNNHNNNNDKLWLGLLGGGILGYSLSNIHPGY